MKTRKFKITPDMVRKANGALVQRGVEQSVKSVYDGTVTVRILLDGVEKVQEISKDRLNKAFQQSLAEYAEKL